MRKLLIALLFVFTLSYGSTADAALKNAEEVLNAVLLELDMSSNADIYKDAWEHIDPDGFNVANVAFFAIDGDKAVLLYVGFINGTVDGWCTYNNTKRNQKIETGTINADKTAFKINKIKYSGIDDCDEEWRDSNWAVREWTMYVESDGDTLSINVYNLSKQN